MNVRSDETFVVRSLNSRSRMSIVSLTHITRKFSKSHSNITRTSQVHESVCSCFSCVFSNLKVLYMERGARLLSMRRNSIRRNDRHPPHLVVRVVKVTDRAQNLFRVWTFHHLTRTRWTRFEDVKRFVVRVTKMQRRRLQFHPYPHLNRETRHGIR